ncbi:MAG: hypothetical protein LBF16_03285 [Pseudomonadales bacterium]|jgi:predicted HTH transcriptional regulator|nr:hypothetical protein [Pseudomonadales bacterium]
MVFADRIEIISPGHLPDSLNIEAIRHGMTNRRNPTLTEHATHILPYRGLGSGIPRALDEWPEIRFEDEVAGNQFKAIVPRPKRPAQIVIPMGTEAEENLFIKEATPEVEKVVRVLPTALSRQLLQKALGLKDDEHFRKAYLLPALASGLVEMTLPDKPRSRLQRYRLTATGWQWLKAYPDGNLR